ncbi:hypothetical protein QYE76_046293 [Lolium multiflorum]|uniref:Reverse transcriptase domain-containing protein n=1 Tax=Lolium multiflorum TaxID=4521 RepID=A0AAD8TLU6_LOLMU|nr:hypothetical protein QYE76_046293 [Lolium multiflorum]
MDSLSVKNLRLESWNVQGLGDPDKCAVVKNAATAAAPSVLCLQETKLSSLNTAKARTFLPPFLSENATRDADGSRGGILTAWDTKLLTLSSSIQRRFSLTTTFASTTTDLSFTVTNVYAPSDHSLTDDFVSDMVELLPLVSAPSAKFNALIHHLALQELPLLDRRFTWTNRQNPPTLARLDRVFFNADWDAALPNSTLTLLHRPTSDHTPLLVTATTDIPHSQRFHFENSWLLDPTFLSTTLPSWHLRSRPRDATSDIAAKIKTYRFAVKVWKRAHRYTPFHDNNCKFVIDLMDFFEESRPLSGSELGLRDEAWASLLLSIRQQAARWKQRGKFRAIKEGDENTRFFHALASSRLRRNHIRVLDVDGVHVVSHDAKAAVLHGFYSNLLGLAQVPEWHFCLRSLYADARPVDEAALVARFGLPEIKAALLGMDRASTPGPNGLGPSFYKAAWGTVAPDLQRLFDAFFSGGADLGSINRAHIILLPKKGGRAIAKLLPPPGHSISENFVYATEIVQCCHKRRAPAFALKLDFAKAFDSINWSSLRAIMRVRGFPELWCDWLEAIFTSSRSAVVLNGIPGRWITCRRGLRQGDPLSPYLFLLVADVLQKMVQQDGVLEHPLLDGAPPVVLQYADDMLVIFRADAAAARHLRSILDMFSQATGLVINFHKSTLVPMHVDADVVTEVRDSLGCTLESFPQCYLGLPLSCDKLNPAAFAPLIAKVDSYLSGWRAVLLSPGGRIVLINAVLNALPTYAMAAMLLPPPVLKALDALHRSFLWAAADHVSGAQCLVACAHWSSVCSLIPLYRSISKVQLGDGARCAFWLDSWLPVGAICSVFPALFSHAIDTQASVAAVLRRGLDSALVTRITATAAHQRSLLLEAISGVTLSSGSDTRVLTRCAARDGRLRSADLYKLVCFGGVRAEAASFVWESRAPSRVKFFGWLLSLRRIQTRDTLLRKNILRADECGCPLCPTTLETAQHLVIGCPFAQRFWASVGAPFDVDFAIGNILSDACWPGLPAGSASTFILLCCWQLWKHRNGVVFDSDTPSLHTLRRRCREDAALWLHRLPATRQADVEDWLLRLAVRDA